MKKLLTAAAAAGLAAGTALAGAGATLDFANAHVWRGATVVDEFVVQPGIELYGFGMPEEWGGIAVGAWASCALFEDDYNNMYETDWYLMYNLPQFVDGLDIYVGLTEYQYSVPLGERELNIGLGYQVAGVALGASGNFMLDDENPWTEGQSYFDFSADYALDVSEELDVSVGGLISYMIQGDGNDALGLDDGLNHLELYGSVGYDLGEIWSLGFSLTYIGQLDDQVLSDAAHDVSLLGMFSIGCDM